MIIVTVNHFVICTKCQCFAAAPKLVLDTSFQDTLILKAGTSSAVEIPFTAHPQPSVSLTFNGGDVRSTERIRPETADNKTSFVIDKSERPDSGEYVMTLTNEFGTATLTLKVMVLGELN